jgi:hypothetical protein
VDNSGEQLYVTWDTGPSIMKDLDAGMGLLKNLQDSDLDLNAFSTN